MDEREKLMYRLMDILNSMDAPIIFKGGLITKLLLDNYGFSDLSRKTQDIDANWTQFPVSMEEIVDTINCAAKEINPFFSAVPSRNYGENRSAGIKIIDKKTCMNVLKMDIDLKVASPCLYYIGGLSFQGVDIKQIIADKVCSISNAHIFRRVKDLLDLYGLAKCGSFSAKDIMDLACSSGRKIGDFSAFENNYEQLEYAYSKLKGTQEKPDFFTVYAFLNKFLEPFSKNIPICYWDAIRQEWRDFEVCEQEWDLEKNAELNLDDMEL